MNNKDVWYVSIAKSKVLIQSNYLNKLKPNKESILEIISKSICQIVNFETEEKP